MLRFYKTTKSSDAIGALTQRLKQELSGHKRVLWLVPGGSNIPLSVQVMRELAPETHANLAIMLTDERYGLLNHPDSNTLQLTEAGFDPGTATVIPVLTADNLSLEATCARYNQAISTAFDNADVIVGQFGMGADGHIAGMLPGSPAVNSKDLVAGYDAGNFIRITLTAKALKHVDVAYVFAYGDAKHEALTKLKTKKLTLKEQPAQVLKQMPESYMYNDQVEGEAA